VRRIALIVNPFASGVDEARMHAVEAELARVGEVTLMLTQRPRHATELAESSSRDYDAVVVFSGDGGFNEALNGADGETPIGFVPGGGTSVLPRALGLPAGPVAAARSLARAIEAGSVRRISLGTVNGRRFSFGAGVGLDAEAVRRVDARGRAEDGRRPGDLAFTGAVVRLLVEHRGRFEDVLEIEGFGRAAFAFVANADPYTFAGPMPLRIAPEARFERGLDLVAPRRVTPASLPRLAVNVLTPRRPTGSGFHYGHDLDRIVVRCDRPLPLQADGEDLGDVREAVFEAQRSAVAVLV
jgi:diacylglycerol kinase family enzyme